MTEILDNNCSIKFSEIFEKLCKTHLKFRPPVIKSGDFSKSCRKAFRRPLKSNQVFSSSDLSTSSQNCGQPLPKSPCFQSNETSFCNSNDRMESLLKKLRENIPKPSMKPETPPRYNICKDLSKLKCTIKERPKTPSPPKVWRVYKKKADKPAKKQIKELTYESFGSFNTKKYKKACEAIEKCLKPKKSTYGFFH